MQGDNECEDFCGFQSSSGQIRTQFIVHWQRTDWK
jgi:hypothetical protein